jgi:hypothetical protein
LVLPFCDVPPPKAIPHRPLSLIIFPAALKLPVVALRSVDAAIVQVPHQHSLADRAEFTRARANAHGAIICFQDFAGKKRRGTRYQVVNLASKRDGRQPLDQSREGQSGGKSAETRYQAHLKVPTLTVASEPGRPVSKLLISRPSSVAPQFQIRMKLGLVTIDLLPLSLY